MGTILARPKTHAEWLELRKGGIGSSEVGTILGVNPYDTPYQLWLRKTGQIPPTEETFAMKAGHYLEDAVAQFFADETGYNVVKSSAGDWLVWDSEKPHLRVSPDRTYWLSKLRRGPRAQKGILECKTTQRTIDPLDLPKPWYCQLQYQLGVVGYERGALAWLTAGREFGHRDILFHKEFYEWMVEKVDAFWSDCIIGGKEPALISVSDVTRKYAVHTEGKIVEASEAVALACAKYNEIKEAIGKMEEEKEEAEKVIKMAFGDAEAISYGGLTLATWRAPKERQSLDSKRLIAEHPELVAQYMKTTPVSRRLCVK